MYEYDLYESLLAGLGIYLLSPLLNGVGLSEYSFTAGWEKRLMSAGELGLADYASQYVVCNLIDNKKYEDPVKALSTGLIYGAERKFLNKKGFAKSFISGSMIDAGAIVLTEPITKITGVKKYSVNVADKSSGGAHYNSIVTDNRNKSATVTNNKNAPSVIIKKKM